MTHNLSLPSRYSTSRTVWPTVFPSRFIPRLPSLGLTATMCGLIAIATILAPQWVDSILPNFRERYLPIVSIVVGLSLLGAFWRLIKATLGLLFFGAATLALIYTAYGASFKNFEFPKLNQTDRISTSVQTPTQRYLFPDSVLNSINQVPSRAKLPPALPDEAYFPKQRSPEGGGTINNTGGINSISRYVLGMLPRHRNASSY
jgi:hypothetical protein